MVREATPDEPRLGDNSTLRDLYDAISAIPDDARHDYFICLLVDQAYWIGVRDGLRAARP